jgi:hypothetical protein
LHPASVQSCYPFPVGYKWGFLCLLWIEARIRMRCAFEWLNVGVLAVKSASKRGWEFWSAAWSIACDYADSIVVLSSEMDSWPPSHACVVDYVGCECRGCPWS